MQYLFYQLYQTSMSLCSLTRVLSVNFSHFNLKSGKPLFQVESDLAKMIYAWITTNVHMLPTVIKF